MAFNSKIKNKHLYIFTKYTRIDI